MTRTVDLQGVPGCAVVHCWLRTCASSFRSEDRARLASIIDARNRPPKHIQRVQIVLFSADCLPVLQVARCAGVRRPWHVRKLFTRGEVSGLTGNWTPPVRSGKARRRRC